MAHLKYGFLRVLKQRIDALKDDNNSWVHVNDVEGFIGPEVSNGNIYRVNNASTTNPMVAQDGVEPQEQLAQELFSFCRERLAKYKIPRIIEFSTTLPKTISGKIRRIELRANEAVSKQHKEIRDHEYFHDKY